MFTLKIQEPTTCHCCCNNFSKAKNYGPGYGASPKNGPHHVFVGSLTDSVLQQIQHLLTNPQNHILIVTTPEELARVPSKLVERCGIVTDASVRLINAKDKILMLDDEGVIAFDYLVSN